MLLQLFLSRPAKIRVALQPQPQKPTRSALITLTCSVLLCGIGAVEIALFQVKNSYLNIVLLLLACLQPR